MNRCEWAVTEPSASYHDNEWGVPVFDDNKLFEMITLEGAQAGLSWEIILKKREAYRAAFDAFVPERVAAYTDADCQRLLLDTGIVRNRLKIGSTIGNARAFLEVQSEFGTFSRYIWEFVGGKTKVNRWQTMADVPVSTPESDAMSKDLIRRGFRFVGTTICYSFMQAVGMVNDHTAGCYRHAEIAAEAGRRSQL